MAKAPFEIVPKKSNAVMWVATNEHGAPIDDSVTQYEYHFHVKDSHCLVVGHSRFSTKWKRTRMVAWTLPRLEWKEGKLRLVQEWMVLVDTGDRERMRRLSTVKLLPPSNYVGEYRLVDSCFWCHAVLDRLDSSAMILGLCAACFTGNAKGKFLSADSFSIAHAKALAILSSARPIQQKKGLVAQLLAREKIIDDAANHAVAIHRHSAENDDDDDNDDADNPLYRVPDESDDDDGGWSTWKKKRPLQDAQQPKPKRLRLQKINDDDDSHFSDCFRRMRAIIILLVGLASASFVPRQGDNTRSANTEFLKSVLLEPNPNVELMVNIGDKRIWDIINTQSNGVVAYLDSDVFCKADVELLNSALGKSAFWFAAAGSTIGDDDVWVEFCWNRATWFSNAAGVIAGTMDTDISLSKSYKSITTLSQIHSVLDKRRGHSKCRITINFEAI